MRLFCFRLFYYACFFLPGGVLLAQKPITLEDIWQKGTFAAKGVPGFNFQRDGIHFTRLGNGVIEQYDLRSGLQTGVLFDAAKSVEKADPAWPGKFDGYTFSTEESKFLLATNTEQIYRWSSKSDYFVFDQKTKAITRLHEGPKQRYATFSPDGSKIAFVVENDLYYRELNTGTTIRVTTDGRKNAVINGASDWVYEEEFALIRAFEWSLDGQRLAFLRFNESEVPEFTMERYQGEAYPVLDTFKYPKVGEKNAVVTAWLYDLNSGQTRRVDTQVANEKEDADDPGDYYMPRLAWTPGGQLCLTLMNRHQNHQQLLLADPMTGKTFILLTEKNKYYIDLPEVTFLGNGSGFIMQSEKDGFNHLYHYDMKGQQKADLTAGDWDVTNLYGVDEQNGLAYFQAARNNPMQREIYSVKLNGKKRKQISQGSGYHAAQFSSTFDHYIGTFSTQNAPPQYAVYDRTGKVIRQLEQNTDLQARQKEYGTLPMEFFQFTTSEKVVLNGWMVKPTAPQYAGQQLPVLMFVYGGPGSQQVLDQWKGANYWWFQMLAQQGYVVACVDNRGTGARGEEFKKMTYKQLGHYEVIDQIEAAKYLGNQPFVDKDRIGIFGWSYGGYMSTNCILKGKDVFKSAIAVAPVTNWKWYDSIYTERYMQTHAENPEGYEQNSPVNFADLLQGNYLLVHGLADDNVHFQHTAELANRLVAENKQFDTMVYPNRSHGISGDNAKLHLYTLMTNFLQNKLAKKDKP